MTTDACVPVVRAPGTVVLLAGMRVPCRLAGGFQDTGRLNQDRGLLSKHGSFMSRSRLGQLSRLLPGQQVGRVRFLGQHSAPLGRGDERAAADA